MKKTVVTLLVLSMIILITGNVAWGEKVKARQGAPGPPFNWTPVPGVAGVDYAPNIDQDLFRYQGEFFNLRSGLWYRGPGATGPWLPIPEPPQVFYNIQAPYFKAPPGWAQGRKTGWGDAPMPPGQMKKLDRGQVPPGKAKGKGGPPSY